MFLAAVDSVEVNEEARKAKRLLLAVVLEWLKKDAEVLAMTNVANITTEDRLMLDDRVRNNYKQIVDVSTQLHA